MSQDLHKVRNMGVIAHIDAGKTTVSERILYYSGKIYKMGEVHEGTAKMDYLAEEQERGITITSAATTLPWKGYRFNLIDTPGHVDFTAEVVRSLRVLDGAVVVFDAKEGVEAQSETVWRQADQFHVPRLCFINKMDKIGADFEAAVESIRERLGANPLVIQLPMGTEQEFSALIDLVSMKYVRYQDDRVGASFTEEEIPEEYQDEAELSRHDMIEHLADSDDALMELFLEEKPISESDLRAAIRRATLADKIQPILCGSALKYRGVRRLLDACCDYLPSPLEVRGVEGMGGKKLNTAETRPCDPKAPLTALVFKIISDPHGDLFFLRIYSGTLTGGMRVFNPARNKKENVTRIWQMHAKQRTRQDEAIAGEIVAVVGLKDSLTGDTLTDTKHPIVLEHLEFPETVIDMSIEPAATADRERLGEALRTLKREDPTFGVRFEQETGQTIISGMGELHLEVLRNKLVRDLGLKVNVGRPKVAYRETVLGAAEAESRFVRQTGGRGQFAVVHLKVESYPPSPGEAHLLFEDAVKGNDLSREYLPAIEQGVRDAAHTGVMAGFPLINVKVTVLGGKEHEVDSSEIAFQAAGSLAFQSAAAKASPALLEPIMKLQVVSPEMYFGPIQGDLASRRATITGSELRGQLRVIEAEAPLVEMFGYATELRSLSQGRASYTMEPLHYAPLPKHLAEKILV